jgi:hypothetical protein
MDDNDVPKLQVTTPSERCYTPSPKKKIRIKRNPELTRLLFFQYDYKVEEPKEEDCCGKCLCTII